MPRDGSRLDRSTFLYMDPRSPKGDFAQCGTCVLFMPKGERCSIMDRHVEAEWSCGLYVHGTPTDDQQANADVTPEEAGLVKERVRCEHCVAFKAPHTCQLYERLNKDEPEKWALDTKVDAHGCCNAWSKAPEHHAEGGKVGAQTEEEVAQDDLRAHGNEPLAVTRLEGSDANADPGMVRPTRRGTGDTFMVLNPEEGEQQGPPRERQSYAEGGDSGDQVIPSTSPPPPAGATTTPPQDLPPLPPGATSAPPPPPPGATTAPPNLYPQDKPLDPKSDEEVKNAAPGSYIFTGVTPTNPSGLSRKPLPPPPPPPTAAKVDQKTGKPLDFSKLEPVTRNTGILGAIGAGFAGAGSDVAETAKMAAGQAPEAPKQSDILAAQPVGWHDFLHPSVLAQKFAYQFAESSPTAAAAMFGGALGTMAGGGPETPLGWATGIAGTAAGAALGSTIQALGKNFGAALQEFKDDPEKAWSMAMKRTGLEAGGSAVGFGAFSVAPFAGTLKNIMFQAFGMQPAVAMGEQAVGNIVEGKPAGEGVLETVPGAIVGTAAPLAAHEGARQVVRRIAGEQEVPPAQVGTAPPSGTAGTPAVGEVMGIPGADGQIQRMTVSSITPQGDVVLVDAEGKRQILPPEDVARFRTEPPEEPPAPGGPAAPPPTPPGTPPAGEAPPAEGAGRPAVPPAAPPPAEPGVAPGFDLFPPDELPPPPAGATREPPTAPAAQVAAADQAAATERAATAAQAPAQPGELDQAMARDQADVAAAQAGAAEPAPAREEPAVPPEEPAGTTASVPFMITRAMRAELQQRGYTEDQIRNMKPEEAQAILAQPAPEPPPAAPAAAAPEPPRGEEPVVTPPPRGEPMPPDPADQEYLTKERAQLPEGWKIEYVPDGEESAHYVLVTPEGETDIEGSSPYGFAQTAKELEEAATKALAEKAGAAAKEAEEPVPGAEPPVEAAQEAPIPRRPDNRPPEVVWPLFEREFEKGDFPQVSWALGSDWGMGSSIRTAAEYKAAAYRRMEELYGPKPETAEASPRGEAPPPEPAPAAETPNAPVITQEQHTKTKEPLWFVRFPEKPDIEGMGPKARSLKGQWSSFRGGGMRPGWNFRSEENANEFARWAREQLGEKPAGEEPPPPPAAAAEPVRKPEGEEPPPPPPPAAPAARPEPTPPGPVPSRAWMNRMDIDEAVERYRDHPVLGPATRFLEAFRDEVDDHSDGWPYWNLPSRAAKKMMDLIQAGPAYATTANLKAALSPIRAFYTRRGTAAGMKFPEIEGIERPAGTPEEPAPPSGTLRPPAAMPSPFDTWADEVFKVYQEQGSEAANELFDSIAKREKLPAEQWSQIAQRVRQRVTDAGLPWGKGVNYVPERPAEPPRVEPEPVRAEEPPREETKPAQPFPGERVSDDQVMEANAAGREAGAEGKAYGDNPYIENGPDDLRRAWHEGWEKGAPEEERPAPTWALIGKNFTGQDLYRDKNGVRSIVDENGVRHTEPFQIIRREGREPGYQTREPIDKEPEWQVAEPNGYSDDHGFDIDKEYYRKEPESPIERIGRQLENARDETEHEPTEAEKAAGNYSKGRVDYHGIPFVMENARGSLREGVDENGEPWESQLAADYGYISRTEGADGDHVDAFIGPDLESPRAFVIDQFDPEDGFDEHKVMLGFDDWPHARDAYLDSFGDGRGADRLGNYTPMSLDQLKAWLDKGDTRNPIGQQALPLEEGRRGLRNAVSPGDEGERPTTVQRPAEERPNGPPSAAEERAGARAPGTAGGAEPEYGAEAGGAGTGVRDTDRVPSGQREGAEPGTAAGSANTSRGTRPAPETPIELEGKEPKVPTPQGRPVDIARQPDAEIRGTNFPLTAEAVSENRTPLVKARDNLAAIELAKRLVAEKRPATREEQALLARYVGWGGVSGAFKDQAGRYRKGFEQVGERLSQVLTKPEYDAAARSTLYAHYTSEPVIKAMWDAMQRMGFKEGSVFEPGMGIGHFLGFMPPDLAQATRYHGLEIDPMTATIAKLLYPESGIREADFIRTPYPENVFDIAIGNPPFHDTKVQGDPKYRARGFMLHDYFFAKSIDSVRPGGLLGFITSAGTMNKLDTGARKYLADRAEFVGGVRMPSSTFARSANTEVTTDILFFKKRGQILNHAEDELPDWAQTVQRDLPNRAGETITGNVNRYFSEHPEQVLGEEGFFDKLVAGGDRYAVRPNFDVSEFPDRLNEALSRLPENIMGPSPSPKELAELDFSRDERKDGSYYEAPDGTLMQYRDGAGRPVQRRGGGVQGGATAAEMKLIRELIPIRDAMRSVYRADLAGGEEAVAARTELNRLYDDFVARRGPINKTEYTYRRPTRIQLENLRSEAREDARDLGQEFDEGDFDARPMIAQKAKAADIARARQEARDAAAAAGREFNEGTFDPENVPDIVIAKQENLDAFGQDPEHYRLSSIEDYDKRTGTATKRTIFFENPLDVRPEAQITSANDGVLWSMNQHGRLDLDQIAEKIGKSRDEVIQELGDSIYRVPGTDNTYLTAGEYLSGDVVSKLEQAQTALDEAMARGDNDLSIQRNVDALKKVQPAPISPADISIRLGMPWMGTRVVSDFMRERLNLGDEARVTYMPALGKWTVELGETYGDGRAEWGTQRMTAAELLDHALNRTPPKVYDPGEKRGSRILNETATQAALDKVEAIQEAFDNYVFGNGSPEQTARLDNIASLYNDRYNRTVLRQWNGDYLTTPGIAKGWTWRPHQTRAIARIIQDGNAYIAHAVGAGKTSVAIGAAMEMRRLGLVRKPMIVVPNHMLGQFAKEWYEQYPTARLMIADEDRFHTDRRRQFIADVAQQDLDGVVITNSAFKKLPISREYESKLIEDEIAQLDEAMEGLGQDPTDTKNISPEARENMSTVKQLQSKKLRMEERLRGATGTDVDQTHTFEELGVDFLFVDESHQFRKLQFSSQMSVKGISQTGSDMAWDLYAKTRYLDEQNPGRSLVMMSGTPVTNTIGELYSLSRYIQPAELEKQGIPSFDAWAQTFGREATELEQTPQGTYEQVTRFSKIVNAPELYKMVGKVMDVVTNNDLSQYVIRPKLKDGQRTTHLAERNPWLDKFQEDLGNRVRAIRARKGPPSKGDDILLGVIGDGRLGAIDPRLIDPTYVPGPNERSKLDTMIENVHRIWGETANQPFYEPGTDKELFRGPATQLIFSNLGIQGREGPNGERGFSVYNHIKRELIRRGVPANEIAFIKDYDGKASEKQRLFNDMNAGKVRILIGSTQKMGTGMNVQRRLFAVHNLDPLWFPADDEQRNGRILRQGNFNPEVQIHDYSTKGTYDSTMWGMMGRKGRFIEAFFRGDPNLREIDDLGEASVYEQASAMSTADERAIELTQAKQDLQKLLRQRAAHQTEQFGLRGQIRYNEDRIKQQTTKAADLEKDIAKRDASTPKEGLKVRVDGKDYTDSAAAGKAIDAIVKDVLPRLNKNSERKVADINGFEIRLGVKNAMDGPGNVIAVPEFIAQGFTNNKFGFNIYDIRSGKGAIERVQDLLKNLERARQTALDNVKEFEAEIERTKPLVGRPFAGEDRIAPLNQRVDELEAALAAKAAEKGFDWGNMQREFEANGKAIGPDGHEYETQMQTQYGRRAAGEKQRYAVYENPEPGNEETRGKRPLFYGDMDRVIELLQDHTDPEKVAARAEERRANEEEYAKLKGEYDTAAKPMLDRGYQDYAVRNELRYRGGGDWREKLDRLNELENKLGLGRYARAYGGEEAAALGRSRPLDMEYGQFSQGRTDAHEAARDFVLDQGQKNGLENMAIVDRNGQVHASTSDSPETVTSHPAVEEALDDPNADLTVHHNHPTNRGLSSWDIATLAHRGVGRIIAWANSTGAHSMASLTPWARQWIRDNSPIYSGALRTLWRAASDALEPQVRGAVEAGYITEREGNRLLVDLTNRSLDAAGVIDYVSSDDLNPLNEAGKRGMVELGAQAVQERLQRFGARQETDIASRIDRSTGTVLAPEAMARLPKPNAENAAEPGGGGRDLGGEAAVERGLRAAEEPGVDFSTEATAAAVNAAGPPEDTRGWWDRLERTLDISPRSPGQGDHFFNFLNKNFTFPMVKGALDPLSNAKWLAEIGRRRDAAGLAHDYYTALDSWQGKPKALWDKMFSVLELLTLEGREVPLDGRAIIVANEDRPLATGSKPGDVFRIINPDEIRMFAAYPTAMAKVWKDLITQTARSAGWEGEPTAKAIYEAAEAAGPREKARLTRQARIVAGIEMMQRDSYLPLTRSGDYYVRVTPKAGTPDKPGIPGWNAEGFPPTVMFKLMDSLSPAERAMGGIRSGTPKLVAAELAKLRETFPEAEYDIAHGYAFKDIDTMRDLDIPAVDKLMALVASDGRNQLRERMESMGMPKAEARAKAREDYDKLTDAVLDQLYEQRVAGFKKPRLGIPGYDPDFARSTGQYFNWLANHIATMRYRDQIDAADEGLQKHPDPRTRAFWRDWDRRQEDYGDQLNGPLMRLRQGSFYWLLGANAATTAKIMLHPIMRGVPVLTTGLGTQGRMQAMGAYLNASRTILRGLRIGGRGIEIDLNAPGVRASLSPAERAMFDEADRVGILHPQTASELASARTEGEEILSPQKRFMRRVLDIWGSNVSAADRLTRASMLLSGARVAERVGMDTINRVWDQDLNWRNAPEKTPEAFGRFMVDKTVGIWGDINRLPALRSQLGGMIGQFKLYEAGYLSNLHQMMTRMGPEGKVTAALMLGGLGMMGGTLALPFTQDIAQAGDWVYGMITGIEPDLEGSLRHAFDAITGPGTGEPILHGARPFGIDWNGLGFGDIIGKNIQSPLDLIGAAGSTALGSPYRAWQRYNSGQSDMAALMELAPNAVKHALGALYPETLAYTVSGSRKLMKPEEMTDEDRIKRGLGFQTEANAQSYQQSREFTHNRSAYTHAITMAENRLANLLDRGEPIGDAVTDAGRLIADAERSGVFGQEEVARFRRELHAKLVQRAAPQMGSRAQQRYQAVNP